MNQVFSKNAFRGRNVIIAGGAGDIGVEIATEFSKAGVNKIALLDKDTEGLSKIVDLLTNMGCACSAIEVDFSEECSIKNSVKELYNEADHVT